MGEVVALRSEEKPHLVGRASCLVCKHEWEAAAPVGTCYLECPQCSLSQGVMKVSVGGDPARGEQEWTCNCGCDVFKILADKAGKFKGVLCMRCGAQQQF